jgi:hypothetical protein
LKEILKLNTALYKVLPTVSEKLPQQEVIILNSLKDQLHPEQFDDEDKLTDAVQTIQKLYEKSKDEAFFVEEAGSISCT